MANWDLNSNAWKGGKPPKSVCDRSYEEIISEADKNSENILEIFIPRRPPDPKGANGEGLPSNFLRDLLPQSCLPS